MGDPRPDRLPAESPPDTAPRRRRRWPWLVAGAAGLSLVLGALWLGLLARRAESQLTALRTDVTLLRAAVRSGDVSSVTALEADVRRRAAGAQADTSDPLWRAVAAVPDVGNDLTVGRGVASTAAQLANRVLPPLADAVVSLRPERLRGPDGAVDLALIARAGRAVDSALPALANAREDLARLDQRVHVNALGAARTELAGQLADVQVSLTSAQRTLRLLPPMLGADGPRRYFLAFQNPAEARGTGGLIGTFGVLTADHGRLHLDQVASDAVLNDAKSLITLRNGPEFLDRWATARPEQWNGANLTPHFPWAATIWHDKAVAQFGGTFDGVIALDPVALGLMLGDRTVALPDGTSIAGPDVATETMSGFYTRYRDDRVRKDMLVALARGAAQQLLTGGAPPRLLPALQSAVGQGRILLWSDHEAEQAELAATDIAGAMPDASGPFAWVGIENSAGNKADYWLDRTVTYTAGPCPAPGADDQTRESEIIVTLTNHLPPGQPPIVSGRVPTAPPAAYGVNSPYLSVYAARGAGLLDASLDGSPTELEVATERRHAVFSTYLDVAPGQTQVLALHLIEPGEGRPTAWRPQPLVRAQRVRDGVPACRLP